MYSRWPAGHLAGALSLLPRPLRLLAITFGHVVIGVSHSLLAEERAHEHAHVRQYERWGLFFFPLYLASSAAQLVRGRHPYWDNRFERQASFARQPENALVEIRQKNRYS